MGFITSQFDYKLDKNLATMQNVALVTHTHVKGSRIKDSGVYEIEFSYSTNGALSQVAANARLAIGFGQFVSNTSANFNDVTIVRLGVDNDAPQQYPNQRAVKVWVTKTTDVEMDFICTEGSPSSQWSMYNINACAKKIADI